MTDQSSHCSVEPDAGNGIGEGPRQTGILPVPEIDWGAHLCLFYETEQDLLDANAAFMSAGLTNNEFCLWVYPDTISLNQAVAALRKKVPEVEAYIAAGAMELTPGAEWYRGADAFLLKENLANLSSKVDCVVSQGFAGMRASGYAFWTKAQDWLTFRQYEEELDKRLSQMPMIGLCTYKLGTAAAANLLDVVRVHRLSIVLREGQWQLLGTPDLDWASKEVGRRAMSMMDLLSHPFPGRDLLSARERAALVQIAKGSSNKEAARALGISPRTVEFHRANIMRKLEARNVVELLTKILRG